MIYEALLAPTESAPTLLAVKRALLTYDKVFLIDPADRDMMPNTAWISAITPPLPIPISIGVASEPIRPMGKAIGYDEKFDKTFEACKAARDQNLVQVRSTYERTAPGVLNIGMGADTMGYPLSVRYVLWFFRETAANQKFLRRALAGEAAALLAELQVNPELALKGIADGPVLDTPALPLIDDQRLGEHARALSQIARARLGGFIKYAGYCERKNLVPLLPAEVYGGITQLALSGTQDALLAIDDADRFWAKRTRVLDLCHEEFLADQVLDQLPVEEVIKLRTKVWGEQAEAREKLFASVFEIASDVDADDDFEKRVRALLAEYRKQSDLLVRERSNLNGWIKAELVKGIMTGGAAAGTGSFIAGLETLIQSPMASIGTSLAIAAAWLAKRSQDYLPKRKYLKELDQNIRRGAGFGLHNFYSRIR